MIDGERSVDAHDTGNMRNEMYNIILEFAYKLSSIYIHTRVNSCLHISSKQIFFFLPYFSPQINETNAYEILE